MFGGSCYISHIIKEYFKDKVNVICNDYDNINELYEHKEYIDILNDKLDLIYNNLFSKYH